jgi:hypothetical protein
MFVEEVNQINSHSRYFFFKSLRGPTHFISSTPILNLYSWNPLIPINPSISYYKQSPLNEPTILNQTLINIDNFTYQNNSITIPNFNVVEGNSILSVQDNNDHNEVQFMPKGLTSHERSHLRQVTQTSKHTQRVIKKPNIFIKWSVI